MDWEPDGEVNLADFMAFQECFESPSTPCMDTFDRATPCATLDLDDYLVFESQLAGLGGMMAMMGGEGGEMMLSVPWTVVTLGVDLAVYSPGGEYPLTMLQPNSSYALDYVAESAAVDGYVVVTEAAGDGYGFASASPPQTGPWRQTGGFSFLADMPLSHADAGPTGEISALPWDFVSDLQPALALDDASTTSGTLFTFTTEDSGPIVLDVYLWYLDEAGHRLVEMPARLTLPASAD